jgi:hypothetical protein
LDNESTTNVKENHPLGAASTTEEDNDEADFMRRQSGPEIKWDENCELLKEYIVIYGTCEVAWKHCKEGMFQPLSEWCK